MEIKYLLKFLGLLLVTLTCRVSSAGPRDPIRCPLRWEPYTLGTTLPLDSVDSVPEATTSGSQHFAMRALSGRRLGRVDNRTGEAYVVDDLGAPVLNPDLIEVLRNDLGCDLGYVKSNQVVPEEALLVASGATGRKTFVGVAVVGSEYLSGEVDTTTRRITVVDQAGVKVEQPDFFYLTSSSKGIRLEFVNVEFGGDPFRTTIDLMGMDEINNNSPATVTQRLVHRKSVTESKTLSHEDRWSIGVEVEYHAGVSFSLDIPGTGIGIQLGEFNIDFEFSFTDETSVTTTIGLEVTKEIKTEREITVPPYVHVQACTIMGKIDKFLDKPWTATGTYTAKGWTGQEVHDKLKTLATPPQNMQILPDRVTSTERGKLSGEAGISNVMMVLDARSADNCLAVDRIIRQIETIKAQGIARGRDTRSQELELQRKVAHIMKVRKPI